MNTRPVILFVLSLVLAFNLAFAAVPPVRAGLYQPGPKFNQDLYFKRIATFPVYLNTSIDQETVAEIIAATPDGRTLVYTDAEAGSVGFIDITDPANPQPLGAVAVDGEPTSVDIAYQFAFVAVNTSESYTEPSGKLVIFHIPSQKIISEHDLGGQPDSISLNLTGRYAAIVIENERDEDLGDGTPPQAPPGRLVIFDALKGSLRDVDLTGIADLYPEDPEPEYVEINHNNIAVVTLQENNHIILVDVRTAKVIGDFSAGAVDLDQIDTVENDVIELNSSLEDVLREPDGVSWVTKNAFATANEGDLNGGSRGFTIFNTNGVVLYESGNMVDHVAARLGHYPENRSENKGSEPEGVEYGLYRSGGYLFVGTERANLVLVYRLRVGSTTPEIHQALAGGIGPEGLLAIPQRNLFVTASEVDDPGGIRSAVTIYKLDKGPFNYPAIASTDDSSTGTPIPWGALSALAADPQNTKIVYSVEDSYYNRSSIFGIDVTSHPALIIGKIDLMDSNGVLAAVAPDMVNPDGSVNLDAEGLTVRKDGGFWIASEGAGRVDDPENPVTSLNLLVAASQSGMIEEVVTLPQAVNDRQRQWGFEGVATTGAADAEVLFVAFQRPFVGDPADRARIGRYDTATGEWTFYYYPLEAPVASGWVGLSEITALDDETFMVIERDNQTDVYAEIKRLYQFSVAGPEPAADDGSAAPSFPVVEKTLVYDLLPDLKATGGAVIEKVEGLAVLTNGTTLVVTDNDGVDGSNGETQLLRIEDLFD